MTRIPAASPGASPARNGVVLRVLAAVALPALLVASGCDNPPPKAPAKTAAPVAAPKETAAAPVAAVPAADTTPQQVAEYNTYSASNKRDPFHSFLTDILKELRKAGPTIKGPSTELTAYDVSRYAIVAIIYGVPIPAALLTVNGHQYTVHTGQILGNKYGRITQITSDCIHVDEEFTDQFDGRRVLNKVRVCLPEEAVVSTMGGADGGELFMAGEEAEARGLAASGTSRKEENADDRIQRYRDMMNAPLEKRQELYAPQGAAPASGTPPAGGPAPPAPAR